MGCGSCDNCDETVNQDDALLLMTPFDSFPLPEDPIDDIDPSLDLDSPG